MLSPWIYASSFNVGPTGNYLLSPSSDPVILAVNDAFLETASRRREELVGMRLFAAFPANPADTDDTGVEALRRSLQRVLETGKPDAIWRTRYPIQVSHERGGARYEERFWNAMNTPVFDAHGRLVCISHTTTDITAQLHAEAALRRSEARYRRLFESIDQGFCTFEVLFDESGKAVDYLFLETNPVFETQAGIGGVRGKRIRELAPELEEFWFETYGKVARTGVPVRFEREARTYGRWFDVYAMRADEANPHVVAALFKDITEQKRTETSLRRADRRKDEFLAMLAHELRNPLAPITAAAELLVHGASRDGPVLQASAIISRQAAYMNDLINDLLDVSRVTRGQIALEKETLDAAQIVADAVEQVRPLIESRGHRLAVQLPPQPGFVLADRKRLMQVITNLLNNAAKYTPEGGSIALGIDVDGNQVRFDITDDGIGMEPDLVGRVFDLFVQGERAVDRLQGGLGIGLSLARSLVDLHGGSVSARSDGPGKGSCFSVFLPRVQPARDAAANSMPPEPGRQADRRLKVMVVDDNVNAAIALKLLVEAWGHQVFLEHDPYKALELARLERPDVCLLDIGLPGMDGNELARSLRAQPETASATLVAVSGYGQEQDRETAFGAGIDHHLVKPLDSSRLAAMLGALARRAAAP